MKDNITKYIKSSLFNGFVKVIFGAEGVGLENYVFNILNNLISEEYGDNNVIDLRCLKKEQIKEEIVEKKKTSEQFVFLLDDIFNNVNAESLINLIVESDNLDMICTTNVWYPKIAPEKYAMIRGRISTIYYPSTIYPDYLEIHKDGNVIDFLFKNDLDQEVIKKAMLYLKNREWILLQNVLDYYTADRPISIRVLKKDMQRKHNLKYSNYEIDSSFAEFKRREIIYSIDRYDIKEDRIINYRPVIFPIDTRFYKKPNLERDLYKFANATVVARLFYDNWKVFKAVYDKQRRIKDKKRIYIRNNDAGYLIIKDNKRFLLFVEPFLNKEVLAKIKNIPTKIPIYVITMDATGGFESISDGITYCSLEYFLKEGMNNYAD